VNFIWNVAYSQWFAVRERGIGLLKTIFKRMKKNVIISGASGNLGRAAVQRFSADGYFVVGTVSPGGALGFEAPENVVTAQVDLRDEKRANEFVDTVVRDHGTIDAALLLVGGYAGGNLSETDGAAMKKMISLNFETAYYIARPVFEQMMKQENGGRIVLVGSKSGLEPALGTHALGYTVSKSMLFTLADVLNAEAKGKNVVTSVVVPSTIDTPQNRKDMPKADFSSWVKAEEIAGVMSFIASEQAHPLTDGVYKVFGNAGKASGSRSTF
jgi:NAD(P)-dependent dehydrogenase (short-subunit alcohol dehydrogenase family)